MGSTCCAEELNEAPENGALLPQVMGPEHFSGCVSWKQSKVSASANLWDSSQIV